MVEYLIYFTLYLIITSLLGWIANRTKPQIQIVIHDDLTVLENFRIKAQGHKLKRFNKALIQMGFNFEESNKAMLNLKTAMDKVCDEKKI